MHDLAPLTPRQRMLRLAGGIACIVGGIVVFQVSARLDADNRAALISIIMIVVGTGWIGQAARGHVEPSGSDVERGNERTRGLPGKRISAERTAVGFVAAWILPGAGHWLIGRRAKAVLFFVTITTTFVVGLMLAHGRNFNYDRDGVYYLAYMFNGLETLLAWATTQGLERTYDIPNYQLGFLYSAVACLLNVVAMMDFLSTCSRAGQAPALREPSAPSSKDGIPEDRTAEPDAAVEDPA